MASLLDVYRGRDARLPPVRPCRSRLRDLTNYFSQGGNDRLAETNALLLIVAFDSSPSRFCSRNLAKLGDGAVRTFTLNRLAVGRAGLGPRPGTLATLWICRAIEQVIFSQDANRLQARWHDLLSIDQPSQCCALDL
jgi:hypothetical protein